MLKLNSLCDFYTFAFGLCTFTPRRGRIVSKNPVYIYTHNSARYIHSARVKDWNLHIVISYLFCFYQQSFNHVFQFIFVVLSSIWVLDCDFSWFLTSIYGYTVCECWSMILELCCCCRLQNPRSALAHGVPMNACHLQCTHELKSFLPRIEISDASVCVLSTSWIIFS